MIPFAGVRSSWLIVARYWLLSLVASSASSRAAESSASARLRSLMSRRYAVKAITSPPASIEVAASSIRKREPSARRAGSSSRRFSATGWRVCRKRWIPW